MTSTRYVLCRHRDASGTCPGVLQFDSMSAISRTFVATCRACQQTHARSADEAKACAACGAMIEDKTGVVECRECAPTSVVTGAERFHRCTGK